MDDRQPFSNLFVCGLYGSGVDLIESVIRSHPAILHRPRLGAIERRPLVNAPYILDHAYGGPGRFAFASAAHLTERSPLARKITASAWVRSLGPDGPATIERSPLNILRTRFLQALIPDARFVIVQRHPIPVSLATLASSHTSPFSLIWHWVRAHSLLADDLPFLNHALVLPYEAFVAAPQEQLDRVWRFLDLPPHRVDITMQDGNPDCFALWQTEFIGRQNAVFDVGTLERFREAMRRRVPPETLELSDLQNLVYGRSSDAQDAVLALEHAVRAFGYSLTDFSVQPVTKETGRAPVGETP